MCAPPLTGAAVQRQRHGRDPASRQALYRFTTGANERPRAALEAAPEAVVRRPLELWFGSVFAILAQLCAGKAVWLALLAAWRTLDAEQEADIATRTPAALAGDVTWSSQFGGTLTHRRRQLAMHVPLHGSEHRAHAATG